LAAKFNPVAGAFYSGCQKNVAVFKHFFYNRTIIYAPIPQFGTLL